MRRKLITQEVLLDLHSSRFFIAVHGHALGWDGDPHLRLNLYLGINLSSSIQTKNIFLSFKATKVDLEVLPVTLAPGEGSGPGQGSVAPTVPEPGPFPHDPPDLMLVGWKLTPMGLQKPASSSLAVVAVS